MGHDHAHGTGSNRRRLTLAIGIVASVLLLEVIGAALTGSLALLADAGHMLSDLFGLIVALTATVVAARPATDRATFGFQRAEVFGALINGLILLGVAGAVSVAAIARLISPSESAVLPTPMLIVAIIGLAANIAGIMLLRPAAAGSINMRGAYLEVLGDALGSVAVIVAAIVILLTGFTGADAVASLVIAAMIVPRAFVLLRDVVRVFSQSTPADTDICEIRRHLLGTAGVVAVHDVHVWAITSGAHVFTAHIVVEATVLARGTDALLDELSGCLSTHFDVAHSTFQLEPTEHAEHEDHQHR
ncbi:cobalt-zinc-cadmium efflux system protein [Cryobacterium flavum]|uniref:Cation transporter n=1 Tax=Cryobacterium flavum TaxID=1424659 RepID=A0A4R8V564_9MICO|nr:MULTISPECIES: cation diffusion facilitator family transporter [Cryobacterium]TFB76760.1 cation transporter [Cryobacterium flavum]SDO08507.1 cobalt-zinc-cadmium efflux system protein [Cryobacterium flavum]